MGTLATGLKLKRRKLKLDLELGSTLEAKKPKAEPLKVVERPITEQEQLYNDIAAKYPTVDKLVEALGLTLPETRQKPRKAEPRPLKEEVFSERAKENLKVSGENFGKGLQISAKPIIDTTSVRNLTNVDIKQISAESKPRPLKEEGAQISPSKSISKTLAELVLPPNSNEHRPELRRRIMKETGATPEQAELKLQELIDTEQILETLGRSFYLKGSAPF